MFSKPDQTIKKNNSPEVEDLIIQKNNLNKNELITESEAQPDVVKLVEKISGILSPYFIVIVGLYLYENNFFLGTILILLGMFSLLKISYEDILLWIEKIKALFNKN